MKMLITMGHGEVYDSYFTDRVKQKLNELGEIIDNPYDRTLSADEVVEMGKNAEILITGWGTIFYDMPLLNKLPNLKLIVHTGATIAPLAGEAAFEKGIKIISGQDIFGMSVAEGCLCYTMAGLRRIYDYVKNVKNGGWKDDCPGGVQNKGLFGKKVGIIGYGSIAEYFVKYLQMFDTEIFINSGHLKEETAQKFGFKLATREEIFENCDIISIHLTMIEKNIGVINKNLLSKIKQGALFINTARGPIIDEDALIEELQTGRFSAVLDVFVTEPLDLDNPLRKLDNVLAIPHLAGPTIDMREQVILKLADDIKKYQMGEKLDALISFEHSQRMTKG